MTDIHAVVSERIARVHTRMMNDRATQDVGMKVDDADIISDRFVKRLPEPQHYRVWLIDRIRELSFGDDEPLTATTYFQYTWDHGSERMELRDEGRGGHSYGGAFHPNKSYCEGQPWQAFEDNAERGLCYWCGSVMW